VGKLSSHSAFSNRPVMLPAHMRTEARRKRGRISIKYHLILLEVFIQTFANLGSLRGGSSMKKSGVSPGRIFAVRYPMKRNTRPTVPIQVTITPGESAARPKITPSWAEQGMASARRTVAITRSLTDSKVLVTMVAMVPQPKPRVIGMTARPERPIFLNNLSMRRESLGR